MILETCQGCKWDPVLVPPVGHQRLASSNFLFKIWRLAQKWGICGILGSRLHPYFLCNTILLIVEGSFRKQFLLVCVKRVFPLSHPQNVPSASGSMHILLPRVSKCVVGDIAETGDTCPHIHKIQSYPFHLLNNPTTEWHKHMKFGSCENNPVVFSLLSLHKDAGSSFNTIMVSRFSPLKGNREVTLCTVCTIK